VLHKKSKKPFKFLVELCVEADFLRARVFSRRLGASEIFSQESAREKNQESEQAQQRALDSFART
jgi:hypothetical protein